MKPIIRPLLSDEECQRAVAGVDRLHSYWVPFGRDPQAPYFHILPTALYTRQGRSDLYSSEAEGARAAMLAEFSWLYEKLCRQLEQECQAKVSLTQVASLPGFHIYGNPMPNGGAIHLDFPEVGFDWPQAERYDFSAFLSVTLAIRVPAAGAGLRIWAEGARGPFEETAYQAGSLYYLRERLLHQIAPSPDMVAGDRRITLQAHGARLQTGEWELYF